MQNKTKKSYGEFLKDPLPPPPKKTNKQKTP